MHLTVVKRRGNVLSGWDGYGVWQEVVVSDRLASDIGQQLCYVTSVLVTL